MFRERITFVIAVATLVHCFGENTGEGLEAKLAGAKLPTVPQQFTMETTPCTSLEGKLLKLYDSL
jgi:hypothetical protein